MSSRPPPSVRDHSSNGLAQGLYAPGDPRITRFLQKPTQPPMAEFPEGLVYQSRPPSPYPAFSFAAEVHPPLPEVSVTAGASIPTLPPHSPSYSPASPEDSAPPPTPQPIIPTPVAPPTSHSVTTPSTSTPTPMDINAIVPVIEPMRRKRPFVDSEGFTHPVSNKSKKTPQVQPPTPTPVATSNTFAPLRQVKPPPIVLSTDDYSQSGVTQFIHKYTTVRDYRIQSSKTEIKVFCTSFGAYDTIIHAFKQPGSKVTFHTYAKKGTQRNKKYLLTGLDLDHPIEQVQQALSHPDLIDARRMTKTNPQGIKTPIEPIIVTFRPSYKYDTHLKNIKAIDNIIVYHKPYTPNQTIAVCHKCQRMGHTKNHCHHNPRCVRCSGQHLAAECKRDENPLKCANCGGNHPASYRDCPTRVKLLEQAQSRRLAKSTTPVQAPSHPVPQSFVPAPQPLFNPWAPRSPSAQTLYPAPAQPPPGPPIPTLPLPTPPSFQAPQPTPLLPQPTTVDPNVPSWVTELKNQYSTMMQMVQQLFQFLTALLTRNG